MSWGSRFGGWAPSRWSPFTSRGDPSSGTVTDKDFSYITAEDLDDHNYGTRSSRNEPAQSHRHHEPRRSSNLRTSREPRDTDILVLRHQRVSYPVHFDAYSIDDGELTIGSVRDCAARKLEVSDARRIRLFYKGRILKDDRRSCRDEGFRSDTLTDILCVIGDRIKDRDVGGSGVAAANQGRSESEEEDEDDDSASNAPGGAASSVGGVKKKKRKNRKKKSKKASGNSTPTTAPIVEHLPVPTGAHPTHRTASPSTPTASSRPQTPQTPRQKLAGIASNFKDTLLPQCEQYIDDPPEDKAKREFEHKKLTETILAQVLLKLDGVETEGDEEARAQRKALVKEVQKWLGQLDETVKR